MYLLSFAGTNNAVKVAIKYFAARRGRSRATSFPGSVFPLGAGKMRDPGNDVGLKQLALLDPCLQSALDQTAQEQKHHVIFYMSRVFVGYKEGNFSE